MENRKIDHNVFLKIFDMISMSIIGVQNAIPQGLECIAEFKNVQTCTLFHFVFLFFFVMHQTVPDKVISS